jgi:hypothetical protein
LSGSGVIAGDNITFNDTSSLFTSPNAANNVPIDVVRYYGQRYGCWQLHIQHDNARRVRNITPVILNLSGTRVYDANTDADANLFGTSGVLTGIAGQTLQLSSTSPCPAAKNVGTYLSRLNAINNLCVDGHRFAG